MFSYVVCTCAVWTQSICETWLILKQQYSACVISQCEVLDRIRFLLFADYELLHQSAWSPCHQHSCHIGFDALYLLGFCHLIYWFSFESSCWIVSLKVRFFFGYLTYDWWNPGTGLLVFFNIYFSKSSVKRFDSRKHLVDTPKSQRVLTQIMTVCLSTTWKTNHIPILNASLHNALCEFRMELSTVNQNVFKCQESYGPLFSVYRFCKVLQATWQTLLLIFFFAHSAHVHLKKLLHSCSLDTSYTFWHHS